MLKKIDTLKSNKINEILIYSTGTSPFGAYFDSTGGYDIRYLIWLDNSNLYLQKYSYQNDFSFKIFNPQIVSDSTLYNFIKTNSSEWFWEEILPLVYKTTSNGIDSYVTLTETLHATYSYFEFFINGSISEKRINHIFFDYKTAYDQLNLNYERNKNSKLKKLMDLLNITIETNTSH